APVEVWPSSDDPPVDNGFRRPAFDFDHPEVGIAPALALDISVGISLGDRNGAGRPHPEELAIPPARLCQHRAADVAAVEFEQDGTGVAVASGHDGGRDGGEIAAPDQRPNPYARLQPCFHAGARIPGLA